ncbi:MAG: DUF1934 domain-containing protein [Oscillospiraceae bacterium]
MKKVIIKIVGSQADDAAQEPEELAEFTTEGRYICADGCGSFTYQESELTGMDGTRTTIEFTPRSAMLTREGTVNSRMYFVRGQKNTFLYETPYGTATVGLETQRYCSTLSEHGGELEIGYVVDFDHAFVGRNQLKINITEQRG